MWPQSAGSSPPDIKRPFILWLDFSMQDSKVALGLSPLQLVEAGCGRSGRGSLTAMPTAGTYQVTHKPLARTQPMATRNCKGNRGQQLASLLPSIKRFI